MRKYILKFILCILCLGLYINDLQAADNKRIAVLDVGRLDQVLPGFSDLVFVALGKQNGIELLEREAIHKLLQEQALNLTAANFQNQAAVKAGKLWNADAFLMLETPLKQNVTGKKNLENIKRFRTRLIDTRYGIKLFDFILSIDTDRSDDYEQKAAQIAESVKAYLKKIKHNPKKMCLIGVIPFRSEEISRKDDWLSDYMAMEIESKLSLYPDVIILERNRTGALNSERDLVSGLPRALAASSIIIDGSYRLDRNQQGRSVRLFLRCRQGGAVIFEDKLESSIQKLESVYEKAVKGISAALGNRVGGKPANPKVEAEILAREAEFYFNVSEPKQAIHSMEAALALMPYSRKYADLYTSIINNSPWRQDKASGQIIAVYERYICHAERIRVKYNDEPAFRYLITAIENYTLWLSKAKSKKYTDHKAYKDYINRTLVSLNSRYLQLLNLYHDKYKNVSVGEYQLHPLEFVLERVKRNYQFNQNPRQIIELWDKYIPELVRLYQIRPFTARYISESFLSDILKCKWMKDSAKSRVIADYLTKLCTSENINIRYIAEKTCLQFYGKILKNKDKASRYADRLMNTFEEMAIPKRTKGYTADLRAALFYNSGLSSDRIDQYRMELSRFLIAGPKSDRNSLEEAARQLPIGDMDAFLKTANGAEKMLELLDIALENSKGELQEDFKKYRKQVFAAYPELKNKLAVNTSSHKFTITEIFSRRNLPKNPDDVVGAVGFLSKIIHSKDMLAVTYIKSGKTGMVYLNAKKPIFNQAALDKKQLKKYNFKYSTEHYLENVPAVLYHKGKIYSGMPGFGIFMFDKSGDSKSFDESNGLVSNKVWTLTMLNNKIYAKVGDPNGNTGLMEFDPVANASRILLSSRTKNPRCEIDGREIIGAIADTKRERLWIAAQAKPYRGGESFRLYLYNPEDNGCVNKTTRAFNKVTSQMGDFVALSMKKDKTKIIMECDHGWCAAFDMLTEKAVLILGEERFYKLKVKAEWKNYVPNLNKVTLTTEGMFCLKGKVKGQTELLYFKKGNNEPEYILERCFPKGIPKDFSWIYDLENGKDGLLVLTYKALYLISVDKMNTSG